MLYKKISTKRMMLLVSCYGLAFLTGTAMAMNAKDSDSPEGFLTRSSSSSKMRLGPEQQALLNKRINATVQSHFDEMNFQNLFENIHSNMINMIVMLRSYIEHQDYCYKKVKKLKAEESYKQYQKDRKKQKKQKNKKRSDEAKRCHRC